MTSRGQFEYEGQPFALESPDAARILAEIHARKARPRCLCSVHRPEMYAARIGGAITLKRMPETGHLHATACPSYDPPAELTGRGHLTPGVIRYREDGTAELKFRLLFRTGKPRRAAAPAQEPQQGTEAEKPPRPRGLSILGLLHYLWDESGLTAWQPERSEPRSWASVRESLLATAQGCLAQDRPLARFLYVPPVHAEATKAQIDDERWTFLSNLAESAKEGHARGVIIAPIESHTNLPGGAALRLRFMPSDFVMLHESFEQRFASLLKADRDLMELEDRLLMIAAFRMIKGHQYLEIMDGALMRVDQNWIPFDCSRSREVNRLIETRAFIKCLNYDVAQAPIAHSILTDCPQPVALFHTPQRAPAMREIELRDAAESGGWNSWFWSRNEQRPPVLPPAGEATGAARRRSRERKPRRQDPRYDFIAAAG